jgi:hypothetical protein
VKSCAGTDTDIGSSKTGFKSALYAHYYGVDYLMVLLAVFTAICG